MAILRQGQGRWRASTGDTARGGTSVPERQKRDPENQKRDMENGGRRRVSAGV